MTDGPKENRRNQRRAYFTFEDVARETGQDLEAVRRASRAGKFRLESLRSVSLYVAARINEQSAAAGVAEPCSPSSESSGQ